MLSKDNRKEAQRVGGWGLKASKKESINQSSTPEELGSAI